MMMVLELIKTPQIIKKAEDQLITTGTQAAHNMPHKHP